MFLVLLVAALALSPAWALAESGDPDSFEDLGEIDSGDAWLIPEDGGLTWDGGSMTIALPEDASTGYAWSAELDDDTVLTADTDAVDAPADGALPLHTFVYLPGADGAALVSLYYEETDGEDVAAMLSYTATVEGGKIADVTFEDLSDWGTEGDDDGGVLYEGETGGVPLYLPEDMHISSEADGITRLESGDGSIWMTIRYDPEGDAEALLAEFEDEDELARQYADEAAGSSFLSATVDRESDPPRGILVYEVVKDGTDTIVEHTGYQAPSGGVLIVETGYVM